MTEIERLKQRLAECDEYLSQIKEEKKLIAKAIKSLKPLYEETETEEIENDIENAPETTEKPVETTEEVETLEKSE